jgi:hypothetical protein
VKTHYELLGVDPSADADAIKKAFRREIARYHPDKVVHLGNEFQEMAATRAAELTGAYTTLSDAALRAQYDASLAAGQPATAVPPQSAPPPQPAGRPQPSPALHPDDRPPTLDEIRTSAPPPGSTGRFASERADRDVILRRAIAGRVQATVESLYGRCDTPTVRDFDLAMVPLVKPRFLGAPPPRVLVRVVNLADTAAITEAFIAASRARLHVGRSPVVVLLFSRRIADHKELSKAWEGLARQRKAADAPAELTVIPVDVADWSCRVPENCSSAVQKLADRICS